MLDEIRVRPVTGALAPAVAGEITALFEDAFPPDERPPAAEVVDRITAGDRRVWLTEPFRGCAVTVPLSTTTGDVLLEYVAVAADHRRRGIGGAILRAVLRDAPTPLVIEIEDPALTADPAAAGRVEFYRRHGARPVPYAPGYRAPSFTGPELVPLRLWELAAADLPARGPEDVRALVSAIWRTSYLVSESDPRLAAVLAGLHDGG